MTFEEQNHLAKGIQSLKRKGNTTEESSKKAYAEEPIPIMPIQAAPISETTMAVWSPTLPNEDAIPAPLDQGEVAEKKKGKKKVVRKRIRRMIENSGGEGSD
ncbi:hypothetical protein COCNU_scaffold000750G000010 [Cocos nucifera]|nr:hypothetical protein [Cocos nucifera]